MSEGSCDESFSSSSQNGDYGLMTTYEQLQEKMRDKYCGQSLVQIVSRFQNI